MGDVVIRHLIEQTPHAKALLDKYLAQGACDIYLVIADNDKRAIALKWASLLRDMGFRIDFPLSPAKFGAQLQRAEKQGAKYALIIGDDSPKSFELKQLSTRTSETCNSEELIETLQTLFPQI